MKYSLEVGARTVDDAVAAWRGGAQRVELYVSPTEGALTPSCGFVQEAVAARCRLGMDLGLYAMLRPRAGDFLYNQSEFSILLRDAELLSAAGADGFMLGILKEDGALDVARMKEVIRRCQGKTFTLHRAFEAVNDPVRVLEEAVDLGIRYVFIGGPSPYGRWNGEAIPDLLRQAAGRITPVIAIGPSCRNEDLPGLLESTGVTDYHIINGFRKRLSEMKFAWGKDPDDTEGLRRSLGSIEYLEEAAVREVREVFDRYE